MNVSGYEIYLLVRKAVLTGEAEQIDLISLDTWLMLVFPVSVTVWKRKQHVCIGIADLLWTNISPTFLCAFPKMQVMNRWS